MACRPIPAEVEPQRWALARWRAIVAGMLAASVLIGIGGCSKPPPPAASVEGFLQQHWPESLAAQGPPPASFSALEASLGPQGCGQCHASQWKAWQASLHSRSVGPGLRWQLRLMDQAEGNRCLRCHAPLAEQKALIATELGWPVRADGDPPAYVPHDLARQGLVCAGCHLRGHRRFGPVPRTSAGPAAGTAAAAALGAAAAADSAPTANDTSHGGFEAHDAFSDSRFCAHCHQFANDGPRVAGKLHEDTLEQWKASPQAAQGQSCQSCHMPQRQHQWRGIHDAAMTRQAIDVQLQLLPPATAGGPRMARAVVRNVGAGHHVPTYMVAKIELHFARVWANGRREGLGVQTIGWHVDEALKQEVADTRIPAGGERRFEQAFDAPAEGGGSLELTLRVRPGEHYERTFRKSLGHVGKMPAVAVEELRASLHAIKAAEYELLTLREPVGRIAN